MNPTRRALLGLTAAGSGLFASVLGEVRRSLAGPGPDRRTVITSGLAALDRLTGGFQPGQLVAIASEPGMGKTALATNVACHTAVRTRIPVLFLSLSQTREGLAERTLVSEGRIHACHMRSARLTQSEYHRLEVATARLERAPIVIDDPPRPSMADVRDGLDRLRRRYGNGPALLVVDDLYGLGDPVRRPSDLTAVLRALTALVREQRVATLLLWPLPSLLDPDRFWTLADLGGYDAFTDAVVLIHRQALFDEPPPADVAELTVMRSRARHTGSVRVHFVKAYVRFEDPIDRETVQDAGELATSTAAVTETRPGGTAG